MTNELEKQFFQCFGIEPNCQNTFINPSKCPFNKSRECCDCVSFEYPQITDRILLRLVCMANQHEDYPISTNIKNIQARTLRILLRTEKFYKNYYGNDKRYKKLVNQVRTLFEEG